MLSAKVLVEILILGALAGCADPSVDEVHETLTIPAGTAIEGESRSDDDYDPLPREYSISSEIEDLPDGFHFAIEEDYFDGRGHLVMLYTLGIEAWVPPGSYRFEVRYELEDETGDWWLAVEDEVHFDFRIEVLPALGPAQRLSIQGIVEEDPDADTTRTLLLIDPL